MVKKISVFLLCIFLVFITVAANAADSVKRFKATGEVVSADPMFGSIKIKHGGIKGFSGDAETEFFVNDPAVLKTIDKRDMVDFTIVDNKGDVTVEHIFKIGVAPPPDDRSIVGKTVQGVIKATSQVAEGVTSPIAPVNEVVKGTMDVTTGATGGVLNAADEAETTKKF